MSPEEKELLVELSECQAQINDGNYTPEQRVILQSMEKKGWVDLRWVLTRRGQDESKRG